MVLVMTSIMHYPLDVIKDGYNLFIRMAVNNDIEYAAQGRPARIGSLVSATGMICRQ